jgi:hypothetical protein
MNIWRFGCILGGWPGFLEIGVHLQKLAWTFEELSICLEIAVPVWKSSGMFGDCHCCSDVDICQGEWRPYLEVGVNITRSASMFRKDQRCLSAYWSDCSEIGFNI